MLRAPLPCPRFIKYINFPNEAPDNCALKRHIWHIHAYINRGNNLLILWIILKAASLCIALKHLL